VVLTAFYHGSFPKGGLIPEFATGSVPPALGFASVALAAFGIGFAVWARTYLGRNWGMPRSIKENPELVTTGPYAYVRHPIYTGVLLALLGSVLMSGLPWLIVFVVACGYFIYSAYQEEGVMLRTFPESYPPYKARTKMLIPFIF
jgi:protein-S-isoprenylcysteine O-methyltransferase Ste14